MGFGRECVNYELAGCELRMALLSRNGKLLIDTNYDHIHFEEEDNCFLAKRIVRKEAICSIVGSD